MSTEIIQGKGAGPRGFTTPAIFVNICIVLPSTTGIFFSFLCDQLVAVSTTVQSGYERAYHIPVYLSVDICFCVVKLECISLNGLGILTVSNDEVEVSQPTFGYWLKASLHPTNYLQRSWTLLLIPQYL